MTRAGMVRGKPAYLAPSRSRRNPIDRRVDSFSLGIVLHEMLSLSTCCHDSDLVTCAGDGDGIPRPSTRCAGVRDALDAIVMKALERNRDRRYQTAAEMGAISRVVVASGLRVEEIARSSLGRGRPAEGQSRARRCCARRRRALARRRAACLPQQIPWRADVP